MAKAKAKPRPTIYQTSISDMYAQFKKLGPGMVAGNPFSQITPDPHRGVNTQVKDYRAAMDKAQAPLNYRSYEGFLSAVVMVEAMTALVLVDHALRQRAQDCLPR